jgi:hypothetical protein
MPRIFRADIVTKMSREGFGHILSLIAVLCSSVQAEQHDFGAVFDVIFVSSLPAFVR